MGTVKRVLVCAAIGALAVALYQGGLSVYISLAADSGDPGPSALALVVNAALHATPALILALVLYFVAGRLVPAESVVAQEERQGDISFWLGLMSIAVAIILAAITARIGLLKPAGENEAIVPSGFFAFCVTLIGGALIAGVSGLGMAVKARRSGDAGAWVSVLTSGIGLCITVALVARILLVG